jgi:diguanylate cyclase (GGDEF)-like protein
MWTDVRLVARNDIYLLAGLTVASFVIFSRPLTKVLDYTREIERAWDLQLLPGLVILAVMFMFHEVRKRQDIRQDALAAAAEATQARIHAAEMERLVLFGRALAKSLTLASIKAAAVDYLPKVSENRTVWTMVRTGDEWEMLATTGDVDRTLCELAARRALDAGDGTPCVPTDQGFLCFPMIVAHTPVGVLGISVEPAVSERQRIVLAAAAALLAVTLKNAELFHVVHDNSIRDRLTGCYNRQHALEVLDAELRRSSRSQHQLSLLMLDLDHFKRINDQYGHLCGDAVLSIVGRRMHAVLRGSDVKCRYGGEEFLVVLPETGMEGAQRVADVLRQDLVDHPLIWRVGDTPITVPITASFGLTTALASERNATEIIARADAALYRAKEKGRNRICVSGEPGVADELPTRQAATA